MKIITRTIWILSLVSLLTDMASEMLYPVMPLFLKHIGYSAVFIGILEGVAEAVAGLTKGYFGKRSDAIGKRLPFVQLGYTLSAVSKPMLAFLFIPGGFFSRTLDRLGKGIRTGARDGMLSDESNALTRGRVFGFHRSMDTFGAVFGPLIALIYLYFNPDDYRALFLIAIAPCTLSVLLTLLIKESQHPVIKNSSKVNFSAFAAYWKVSPPVYKKLITGLLLFALFNSSDVFLLLKMKESGLTDSAILGGYIFYNLIFALLAYPAGILADKIGLKKVMVAGIFIFGVVYIGFAYTNNIYVFLILLALYGIYAATTEGVSKARISNIVENKDTATANGTYSGFQSISAMIASALCGLLWYNLGSTVTFTITASVAGIVVIYFITRRF